jgi:hypothetical protein
MYTLAGFDLTTYVHAPIPQAETIPLCRPRANPMIAAFTYDNIAGIVCSQLEYFSK